jgi:hypothetical protein
MIHNYKGFTIREVMPRLWLASLGDQYLEWTKTLRESKRLVDGYREHFPA